MTTFNKIVLEKTLLMNILIRMIKMKVTKKKQVNYDVDKELQQLWFFIFSKWQKKCSDFGSKSNGEHLVVENNSKFEFNDKDAEIIKFISHILQVKI